MSKLREKAHDALILARSDLPRELDEKWSRNENEGNDDLTLFAGHSKFLSKRQPTDGNTSSSLPKSDGTGNQPSLNPDPLEHTSAPTSYEANNIMPIGADSWAYSAEVPPPPPEAPPRWEQPFYPHPSLRSATLPLPQHPIQTELSFHPHPTQPPLSTPLISTSTHSYRLPVISSRSQHYLPQPSYEPPAPIYYGGGGMRASIAPPELTHIGLVAQESRLDQRWTSFMQESGYFEG